MDDKVADVHISVVTEDNLLHFVVDIILTHCAVALPEIVRRLRIDNLTAVGAVGDDGVGQNRCQTVVGNLVVCGLRPY